MLGYKGIFNGYTVKRNIKSWFSLLIAVLSIGVNVWLFFSKDFEQITHLLSDIIDVLIGSLPDLLGFCIGGYAILVAMNNLEKMPALLKKQEKTGLSYYINLSADFAMTLLIMCLLLLSTFIMRFVIGLELPAISESIGKIANLFVITLLLWAGMMVIIMIMGTVANIFNTSIILQTVAKLAIEELDKKVEEPKSDSISEEVTYEVKTWFGNYVVKRIIKK